MTEKNMELAQLIARVNNLLQRYQMKVRREDNKYCDPNRGQGRVLSLLKLQKEISQKQLAYLLDMRSQSLGELLVKLEAQGYVEREPSATDKRVMIVRLTPAGEAAAEEMMRDKADEEEVFSNLTTAEQAMLKELLSRTIENLERKLGDREEKDPFEKIFEKMGIDKDFDPIGQSAEVMGDFFDALKEKISDSDIKVDFENLFWKRGSDEETVEDDNESDGSESGDVHSDQRSPAGATAEAVTVDYEEASDDDADDGADAPAPGSADDGVKADEDEIKLD